MNTEHRELLEGLPLLQGLSAGDRKALCDAAAVRPYVRGETLFLQGDPADRLFMVLSGWVSVYRLTPDGDRTILHVVKAGETFAEPAALGLGTYPANAEAVTDAEVAEIPAERFKDVIRRDPDQGLKVIGAMAKRLRGVIDDMERHRHHSTGQRLAGFLLSLAPVDKGPVEIELPFDKALVAGRLGMTPESFSRALKKLKGAGVEVTRNRVSIKDVARLKAIIEDNE